MTALGLVFVVAQGGAHHRCWHKSNACSPPSRDRSPPQTPPQDTTPPETSITSGPDEIVASDSVSFSFTSSEPGSTFECRLDVATWSPCSSAADYSGLWDETHTFEVRAKDAAGNVDPTPATRSFTVQSAKPPPTPTPAPATTRPVGSPTIADADAAARVSAKPENRYSNVTYNQRRPTADELARVHAELRDDRFFPEATIAALSGNYSGTTDEIIQWAAHKWGIDEDVMRAVATLESWWNQPFVNDYDGNPLGPTYGLFQAGSPGNATVKMLLGHSTAFNADMYGALIRYYYDGRATWLNDHCCFSGTTYKAGDLWGAVGAHYSGRWYASGASAYTSKVRNHLSSRTWAQATF